MWLFADPPNVAVFVDGRVFENAGWIAYVGHDGEDGAWQFHGPEGFGSEAHAKVVALSTILSLDPSVGELADLQLGWCAWRKAPDAEWLRGPQQM